MAGQDCGSRACREGRDPGVGEAQAGGALPLTTDRRSFAWKVVSVNTRSWLRRSSWRRLAAKSIWRSSGRLAKRLPILKSWALLIVVSVRSARPTL